MEENSAVDMNITIKEEPLDEHGYSSALQSDSDSNTFTAIKTDPTEPDESYGVSTDSQLLQNDTGGLLGMPVISSPPIINRAQLLNVGPNNTMYSADKPTKKQIAALVKVAAPTTACTTIKQEVDRACHRLSQEGEQSLFLSVNVEKKLCSYVGSDMGRQFLSKRPDIMEHFFQFCQVLYKAEVDSGNPSGAATSPAKKKLNIRRPNILQQRQSTSNTMLPVSSIAPSMKAPVVLPPSQNQTASQNLPLLQPKPSLGTTVKMPEVARILNSTLATQVNSVVPQSIGAGQKRKNKTQADEPKEKQAVGVDMPFRMNIKKLKAGATKSTLLTLRQTLESKSGAHPSSSSPCPSNQDPCNTDITDSSEDVTDTSSNQNTISYGEVLKKAMKTSLSEKSSTLAKQCDLTQEITPKEFDLSLIQGDPLKSTPSLKQNTEPRHELFTKTIKLSDSGLDVHSMFLYFTTKKVKKSDNRPKMKTIILGKSSEGNSASSARPYSFRQRKKKRFGDDYVEDFKEEAKEEGNEENGGQFEIEIKKEVDEEIYDDDKDEDFRLVVSEEEEEEEENDDEIENSTFGEDDQNDESEIKYFNENSLEDLFNDHCYSAKKNCKGSFQCTQCQMMFKWSTSFLQHMVERHEDLLQELNLHQCVMCDKCFVGIRDLANHYRNIHKQLDCFFCKNCNASFNSAVTYDRHVEACKRKIDSAENDGGLSSGPKKKSFVCNICLKVLKTAEGLAKHLNMHKKDAYFICDVCGVRCTSKQTLSCHKYNRHQSKLGNYSCPNCDRRFMSIWTMFRHNQDVHGCTQVICRECGKYFDTQEQLMSHITNDHPHISEDVSRFSCEDCGKWFDQARYLYVHYKEVHRKQRSICGFCGKGFGNREEFHEHKKTHDLSLPNTCKICAKTCSSHEDLEKHMHYHMRGKTLHECGVCKEVFIRRQDLIEHMVTHTKKLPFICKECGKGFKNKGKLKVHMISHVSYRPFQCDICGMAFKMKATLSTHIKRHKELKPFKCDYCPLRFKSVEGSRNHMLHKHIKLEDLKNIKFKVYKCEYCNKLMGQKHMYMRHVRLHTGERPCKCDECGRSFTMPATLNVHKKTHLLRKPHHCDICNFGFIDAHKLGKHYQTLRHKQMVEQKKRIKELAETRSKNMQRVAKTSNVMKSFDIKLEQVNVEDYFDVPERTQIQLGDEMVVVERASEDPLQGNGSQTEAVFQGYTDSCGNLSSLMSVPPTEPNPEFMAQALQNTDLVNQLLVPKTENMDE